MRDFLAVLAIFVGAHVVPALPLVRRRLVHRWGEVRFLVAYSLLSLCLFIWLLRTALAAPQVPLWPPTPAAFAVALILLPVALVLFGAGVPAPNPLSIAFVTGSFDPARPGAVALSRHPLLWGLGLWGLAHVPANGELVFLILFGGLGAFAFAGMVAVELRRRQTLGPARWAELSRNTSLVPGVAILGGRTRLPLDARTLVGAAAGLLCAILLLAGGHQWLFGRDPLAFL